MGIGEGGGEVAKQLLKKTYDVTSPEVVAVYLEGNPAPGSSTGCLPGHPSGCL